MGPADHQNRVEVMIIEEGRQTGPVSLCVSVMERCRNPTPPRLSLLCMFGLCLDSLQLVRAKSAK